MFRRPARTAEPEVQKVLVHIDSRTVVMEVEIR